MDPISNTQRMLLLLREKLLERARASAARSSHHGGVETQPVLGMNALAALGEVDERAFRRAVLEHLLADQLGPELMNDANFQEMVSQVSRAIEDDPAAASLLSEAVATLRVD